MLYLCVTVKDGMPLPQTPITIEVETDQRAIELATAMCATDVLDGTEIIIARFCGRLPQS